METTHTHIVTHKSYPILLYIHIYLILILYWRYNPLWVLASSMVLLHKLWRFRNSKFFGVGSLAHAQPQHGGPETAPSLAPIF
jgi:hypothetical protein